LASSAPRGSPYTTFLPQIKPSSSTSANSSSSIVDEKNVFAIYVSYYVKVKLSLSGMGGEVTLKLPFILGNIETDTNSSFDKENQVVETSTNDLHLNDHQMLNEIRRPNYDRSESVGDDAKKDVQTLSNTSINCSKSLDIDDDFESNVMMNNEGIDFINRKFSEMNRRNSNQSSDSSSISDQDDNENEKQETNVIRAQVHCQKYLESDI
jgi:hypothetical protein